MVRRVKSAAWGNMMNEQLLLLDRARSGANNVDDRNLLGVSTRNTINGGKLAYAVGSNKCSGGALDTAKAISSIGSVKFIAESDPLKIGLDVNMVKKGKVKVAGDAEDMREAKLGQALKRR